eukprot:c17550_g1_i1 orf=131-2272(-)
MGCIHSRPGDDDVVRRFQARKRFMKQAVLHRQAFAVAHMAYLQALRNTGSALRQFAEGEAKDMASSSTPRSTLLQLELPPPPPPHLLSSSPPSKLAMKASNSAAEIENASPKQRERDWSPGSSASDDGKASDTPPPPSPQKSSWDVFNPFRPSSPPFNFQESQHRRRGRGSSQERHRRRHNVYNGGGYEEGAMPSLEDEFDGKNNGALAKWERSNRDFATMVRTGGGERDLLDMVKELDDRFLKASACGNAVSKVLETRKGHFLSELPEGKKASNGAGSMFSSLSWNWAKNPLASNDDLSSVAESELMGSHALTLERLCAWEKKLFYEVKAGEALRSEHQKKCTLLRQQEAKGEDANVVDKTRAAIKRLHSLILVSSQGVDSTTAAVKKMRDEELYPQLVDLSQGLMYMWRTMHECHAHQKQVVLQFKNLDSWVTHEATSEYHHHATSELEKELSNWHDCFCKLVSSQRDYMTSLNGWARLSLLQIVDVDDSPDKENLHVSANEDFPPTSPGPPRKPPSPLTVSLCEEWQKSLDRLPDKVASEAIKSLVAVVHALVVQQSEELKQKRKVEQLSKRLDKKIVNLHSAERKQVEAAIRMPPVAHIDYGKKSDVDDFDEESMSTDSERMSEEYNASTMLAKDPLTEKKAMVEALKKKVEDERVKHGKCVQDTRVLTMNNLQTGLPGVFEAMTGFSAVCGQAFQALYNNAEQGGDQY